MDVAVGILAAQCAFHRGAARVVIIDEIPFRLKFATDKVKGLETINFKEKKPIDELRVLFPHGPDVAIEAVGVHYVRVRILSTQFNSIILFNYLSFLPMLAWYISECMVSIVNISIGVKEPTLGYQNCILVK